MTGSLLITLDGIDGVGKSTQIAALDEYLTSLGHDVMCVRDPGTTEIGTRLRSILLESNLSMHRRTEAMLFMASRCEMVEKVLRPALAAGKTIISDRFLLSTVVYQSIGGDVESEFLWKLGKLSIDALTPDLTLLLDMPAEAAIRRIDRTADRMESRGVDYLESVRQAFLRELPNASPGTAVINADQSAADVSLEIRGKVAGFLTRPAS